MAQIETAGKGHWALWWWNGQTKQRESLKSLSGKVKTHDLSLATCGRLRAGSQLTRGRLF